MAAEQRHHALLENYSADDVADLVAYLASSRWEPQHAVTPGQDFLLAACLFPERLENQEGQRCFPPEYKLHLVCF
jgi:hypothetical protein